MSNYEPFAQQFERQEIQEQAALELPVKIFFSTLKAGVSPWTCFSGRSCEIQDRAALLITNPDMTVPY